VLRGYTAQTEPVVSRPGIKSAAPLLAMLQGLCGRAQTPRRTVAAHKALSACLPTSVKANETAALTGSRRFIF